MHGQCNTFLLTYVVTVAIPVSLAFNIDTTNPEVYVGGQKDFFGYKVLQFMNGTNKGVIVTAPLQLNGTGGICKLGQLDTTKCFNPEDLSLTDETIPVKHFGLSIAGDIKHSLFTVCSPSVAHECNENSYLNSVCYKMTDDLRQQDSVKPAFQACTKKTVDLVFLFDGSASMTETEFNKNKDFIVDIMKSLKNTSIKFAAVQFSSSYREVFNFRDYEAGTAHDKLMREPHMRDLTNTHRALKFVLDEIFGNPSAGASPDATNVLVLITDGDPSDVDRYGIIQRYDEKNIIRFVIGVKVDNLDKFRAIASEPKDKNAFKIENYGGLTGILENFQKKIFKIEDTKVARAGEMTNEMSQSGFSVVFSKDNLILGSVGSNSWRGSLQELHGQKQTQIEDPQMQMDSYMGYSTSVGEKNNMPLYFTGAPRFEHTGQVVLFSHEKNWTASQRITGDQIGSYFGAELCSIDVNSDGDTDFLLVGAPLFYQPQEKTEGRIYVYTLTDMMQLKSELNVTAPSMGRFGTSISSLADLNGDGLRDVAVGAPLEDDNRGAVYIFLGDRHRGIRSTFSQRITGRKIQPELRFFGQSIDGNFDLGEDGLTDIVVGSQGMAVVLSSRPVLNVTAHLSFDPAEISTDRIDCLINSDEILSMVTFRVCFEMVETTRRIIESMDLGLNISYMLDVDPFRQTYRGFFSQTDRKTRNLISTYELVNKETCFDYPIYMPVCVRDTLSPVSIKLNFSQVDSESASGILNVDSRKQAVIEVPFEKQCKATPDSCSAKLDVDFNFMTPTLLVAEENYFNLSLTLSNHGNDSYNTSLSMHYSSSLSFSRMTLTKASRPILHTCPDLEGVLDKTICGVSRPVYPSGATATFKASFHIKTEKEWNDTVSFTITGQSDNANTTRSSSVSKDIPVQFEIRMAITERENTMSYLKFSEKDTAPKKLLTIFKIGNPGWKAFPVNVSLFFPTKLEKNFEIENYQVNVQQDQTQCTRIADMKSEYCSPEKYCKIITCDSFILDKESATEFTLMGDVQFRNFEELVENTTLLEKFFGASGGVTFKSFIQVNYDNKRYVLESHKKENNQEKLTAGGLWRENETSMKVSDVRIEYIIPLNILVVSSVGVGLGLLILTLLTIIMCKVGFFKRKTVEYYREKVEALKGGTSGTQLSPLDPSNGATSKSQTDDKSVQPSEGELLLDDGDKSGTNLKADNMDAA